MGTMAVNFPMKLSFLKTFTRWWHLTLYFFLFFQALRITCIAFSSLSPTACGFKSLQGGQQPNVKKLVGVTAWTWHQSRRHCSIWLTWRSPCWWCCGNTCGCSFSESIAFRKGPLAQFQSNCDLRVQYMVLSYVCVTNVFGHTRAPSKVCEDISR